MSVPQVALDLLVDRLGPAARPDPAGNPLGRFAVRRLLGSGRFSLVAEADDPVLQRRVALKLPLPEFLADARFRARLVREAQLAARLDHPAIVPIHEVVEAGPEVTYLVLGLVNGPTLDRWLESHAPVPADVACRLVAAVADAVQHAHDRNVLHLDLKPSNILLDADRELAPGIGSPRVADFGLARATDGSRPRTTAVMAGTPGYMAPEQLNGPRGRLTERTDVWALGVILYQLLTGRLPFAGTDFASALAATKASPPAPSALRPDLPRALDGVVRACLQRDSADRYPSAAALGADLRAVLAGHRPVGTDGTRRARRAVIAATFILGGLVGAGVMGLAVRGEKPSGTPAEDLVATNGPPHRDPPSRQPVQQPTGPRFTNSIGMKFQRIAPGQFLMGSPPNEPNRTPGEDQRPVTIERPFYLGQHEVTRGPFRAFIKATGYKTDAERGVPNSKGNGGQGWVPRTRSFELLPSFNWANNGFARTDEHPVDNVSWDDAWEFCHWLTVVEGVWYSLPTEEEWEYACRAGSTTRYCFGDDPKQLRRYARVVPPDWEPGMIDPGPDPVGRHEPNAWGLYDMHGNVWEWCLDGYRDAQGVTKPIRGRFPADVVRVVRGGSYGSGENGCRSAYRMPYHPNHRGAAMGFRVWCDAGPDER